MNNNRPYPGLRPFDASESNIFFGRDEHCDQLMDKLSRSRFIAVVGPSGCGKSSLIRAGLIAELKADYMKSDNVLWRIAEMRPGKQPIERLANELHKEDVLGRSKSGNVPDLVIGLPGFLEFVEEVSFPEDTNLLILVDQFEEIFRFRKEGTAEEIAEADIFISLILKLAEQKMYPVYVVMTMRTDYLGHCTLFEGLPEAINQSMFITPRLNKSQLHAAIEGPAKVFGGEVDPLLRNQILKEIGPDPDQLPLMQHALMRTFQFVKNGETGKSEKTSANDDSTHPKFVLNQDAYNAVGGLRNALSKHADEAYDKLGTDSKKEIAKILFKSLSFSESDNKHDVRNPVSLSYVTRVCLGYGGPANEEKERQVRTQKAFEAVKDVVDVFRQPEYCFLMPPVSKKENLNPDTIIDVSHESLIRKWGQLDKWVKEEAKSISHYILIGEKAKLWKEKNEDSSWLESMPQLQISLDWLEKEKPHKAWAERCIKNNNFDLTMSFLKKSEDGYKKARAWKRRIRIGVAIGVAIGVTILALILGNTYLNNKIEEERSFIKLGKSADERGDLDSAKFYFKKALDVRGEPYIYLPLAYNALQKNNENDAISYFKQAMEKDPMLLEANDYVFLGNIFIKDSLNQISLNQAKYYYKKAITDYPESFDPNIVLTLGSLLEKQDSLNQAKYYYKKAITDYPESFDPNIVLSLGNLLKKDSVDQAVHYYKLICNKTPEKVNAEIFIIVGDLLTEVLFEKEAVNCYQKAIDKSPDRIMNERPFRIVANYFLNEEKEKEAQKYYHKAFKYLEKNRKGSLTSPEKLFEDIKKRLKEKGYSKGRIHIFIEGVKNPFPKEVKR